MSADFEQHQRRSGVTVAVQLGHLPFLMLQAQPEQIAVKAERPVEVSNLDGHGVDPSRRKRPATYPFFLYRKPAPGSVAPEPQPISIHVHPGSYSVPCRFPQGGRWGAIAVDNHLNRLLSAVDSLGSEPRLEGGRRDLCTRPWKKDLAGHLDPEWTAPAWDQLERCPLCGERPTSHVDQILEFWAGQLTYPFLGFTRRYLDENLRDVRHRNRLYQQRRHRRHLPALCPPHDHCGEVEELRRPYDGRRNRAVQCGPLLCTLAGVVPVALHLVHADDGQHDMMFDACTVFRGQQLPGGGGEELPRFPGVDSWGVDNVDNGIDAQQRSC